MTEGRLAAEHWPLNVLAVKRHAEIHSKNNITEAIEIRFREFILLSTSNIIVVTTDGF